MDKMNKRKRKKDGQLEEKGQKEEMRKESMAEMKRKGQRKGGKQGMKKIIIYLTKKKAKKKKTKQMGKTNYPQPTERERESTAPRALHHRWFITTPVTLHICPSLYYYFCIPLSV